MPIDDDRQTSLSRRPRSTAPLPVLPPMSRSSSIIQVTSSSLPLSTDSPLPHLDLMRSEIDALIGCHPEAFLDFLKTIPSVANLDVAIPQSLRTSSNLLLRNWIERKQSYLNQKTASEACITTRVLSHRSILFMMSVSTKVNVLPYSDFHFSFGNV